MSYDRQEGYTQAIKEFRARDAKIKEKLKIIVEELDGDGTLQYPQIQRVLVRAKQALVLLGRRKVNSVIKKGE